MDKGAISFHSSIPPLPPFPSLPTHNWPTDRPTDWPINYSQLTTQNARTRTQWRTLTTAGNKRATGRRQKNMWRSDLSLRQLTCKASLTAQWNENKAFNWNQYSLSCFYTHLSLCLSLSVCSAVCLSLSICVSLSVSVFSFCLCILLVTSRDGASGRPQRSSGAPNSIRWHGQPSMATAWASINRNAFRLWQFLRYIRFIEYIVSALLQSTADIFIKRKQTMSGWLDKS